VTTEPQPASIELAEFDQDDPHARGAAHGELWRADIQTLAAIRTQLTIEKGGFKDAAEVTAIAALHLPVLERFSPELHAELLGIARGAATTPEQIVILNHYTDLRDVPASVLREPVTDDPGGCTSIYVPGEGRGRCSARPGTCTGPPSPTSA
jgi:isopenicillin-N N-acyltransferase-like protein